MEAVIRTGTENGVGMGTTGLFQSQGRIHRQVKKGIDLPRDNVMPVSKYNSAFGGKPGAALKAMHSMQRQYGPKKGESVFYATKNKRKSHPSGMGGALAAMQRR